MSSEPSKSGAASGEPNPSSSEELNPRCNDEPIYETSQSKSESCSEAKDAKDYTSKDTEVVIDLKGTITVEKQITPI